MAAGTLVPANNPAAGAAIVPVAADGTNGHRILNDDSQTIVVIINPESADLTATISVPAEADAELAGGLAIADRTFNITAPYFVLPRLPHKLHKQRSGENIGYTHLALVANTGDLDEVRVVAFRA